MSVTEKKLDFNTLEQKIFREVCRVGCEILSEKLEQLDSELAESRDKSLYRHKGSRKSVIKAVMGEVEYSRTVYEVREADGTKRHVYLLDEALGMGGSGHMSATLSALVVKAACESTYRAAARQISETTGQTISHTASWMVVQDVGRRVGLDEERAAKAAAENAGGGRLEVPVLFEEMDGIYLRLQGKSRKEHGKSREMKLAIAYGGTKEVSPGRHRLIGKVACAGFLPTGEFMERKEGVIAVTYNTDEIETRLLNGDGASWIRSAVTDESVHFQLDSYHMNKAIRTNVSNPDMRKMITELLYGKKIDEMLGSIMVMADSVGDDGERDGLLELYKYFANNRDGLIPCHRRGLDIPPPPEGLAYRRMGAMEGNIFTIIGNRMKGRRFCWSTDGANNLARLLCLKHTDRLADALQRLAPAVLPERYVGEITVGLSAAKVALSAGKGYEACHKITAPATPDFKWLRGLGSCKLVSAAW